MKRDVWVFLFFIGILLFTWPVMYLFRDSLQLYLFFAWPLFIVLIFLVVKSTNREDGGN
jgi:hypothetical protein